MTLSRGRSFEAELAFRRRRRKVFGGSDAPAVFGFSDYRDALDVYHEKTRPIDEDEVREEVRETNVDLYRGHAREREAVHLYLDEKGRGGRHETRQVWATGSKTVAVHIDGTIFEHPDAAASQPHDPFLRTGVAEVKAPRVAGFRRLLDRGVPSRYTVQAQFNAAVCERAWCALIFYNDQVSEGPIRWAEVPADEELGRKMLERAELFMQHHVRNRVPPDPERWDLSPPEDREPVMLDRETDYREVDDPGFLGPIAEPLVSVERAYQEARERRKQLKADARRWLEEHEETDAARLPDGSKLRIVRREGQRRLKTDKLREHRPLDRDAFLRALDEGALVLDDPAVLGLAGVEDDDWESMAQAVASELELDFARFERESDPSAHVRIYPGQEDDEG